MYFHVGANSINSARCTPIDAAVRSGRGQFPNRRAYQLEGHFWDGDIISNTINQRPGRLDFDGAIGATKPLSQIIVRTASYSTAYGNYDAFANAGSIAEQGTTTNGAQDVRNTRSHTTCSTGNGSFTSPRTRPPKPSGRSTARTTETAI